MRFSWFKRIVLVLLCIVLNFVIVDAGNSENLKNTKVSKKLPQDAYGAWKNVTLGMTKEKVVKQLTELGLVLKENNNDTFKLPLYRDLNVISPSNGIIFSECLPFQRYGTERTTDSKNKQTPGFIFLNNKLVLISINLNSGIDSDDDQYLDYRTCLEGIKKKYGGVKLANGELLYGETTKYYFREVLCTFQMWDSSLNELEKSCMQKKINDRF